MRFFSGLQQGIFKSACMCGWAVGITVRLAAGRLSCMDPPLPWAVPELLQGPRRTSARCAGDTCCTRNCCALDMRSRRPRFWRWEKWQLGKPNLDEIFQRCPGLVQGGAARLGPAGGHARATSPLPTIPPDRKFRGKGEGGSCEARGRRTARPAPMLRESGMHRTRRRPGGGGRPGPARVWRTRAPFSRLLPPPRRRASVRRPASPSLPARQLALQWTIVTMFSTNVTIYHHLISQAGWNRCNLSIYISIYLSTYLGQPCCRRRDLWILAHLPDLTTPFLVAGLAHLQRHNLASTDVIVAHGKLHRPNLGALAYSIA